MKDGFRGETWVRIMSGRAPSMVWNRFEQCCALYDLPISAQLAARLITWHAYYDAFAPRNAEAAPSWQPEWFSDEGLSLARAVKAELTDWIVAYWDVVADRGTLIEGDHPAT